jgi:hypothetical protein
MKLNPLHHLARTSRAMLVAMLALLGTGALQAANFFDNTISGVNLGNASGGNTGGHLNWAIFTLSGGVTITDTSYDGTYDVVGNVGTYSTGTVGMGMTSSRIKGNVYRDTTAQTITLSGGANYTGSLITGQGGSGASGYLGTAASQATTASNVAKALTATAGTPSTINTSYSYTAVANATIVMNLLDLSISGAGVVLSLNGPSTANYIINISRVLSLSAGAQVTLGGGLQPQNVLFNLTNANTTDVTLGGDSTLRGIILAPNRKVTLTGASDVIGEVIAKTVSLSGRSTVKNPLVSP